MMLLLIIKQHKISSPFFHIAELGKAWKFAAFCPMFEQFLRTNITKKKILLKMQLNYLSIWSNNTSNQVAIVAAIELSLTRLQPGLYILSPADSAVSP